MGDPVGRHIKWPKNEGCRCARKHGGKRPKGGADCCQANYTARELREMRRDRAAERAGKVA